MTTLRPRTAPLLDIKRVAQTADVSIKTVRRWIKSGELRIHRLGRQIRVSEEDFEAFLNRNRQ